MFFFPLWFTISILAGLTSNTYNFLSRYLLKGGDDPTAYAWYNEILRLPLFAFLAIFNWHLVITPYSIFLFTLLGLSEFIGGYFYMKMHAHNELSISTIIYRTRLIWVALIAFFFVGEQLKYLGYIGILVIFFGVSFTVAPKKIFVDKGATYASLTAFVVAINIVIIKLLIPFGSPSVINAAMAIPSIFLYPLLMRNAKGRIKTMFQTKIVLKTFAVIISASQLFLFTLALKFGDASKINAVAQGMLIFAVLAGIIFLKEKENIAKKLIGATVTIAGVVLLSFS